MKNIIIISSSLRHESNSGILAREFERGAKEAGNKTEVISLADKKLNFCIGCLTCHKTGRCVIGDDAQEITEKVKKSDVIVFTTPVYYYGMSGQLKTLLDRLNPLYGSDYNFGDIYLIATCADEYESAVNGTVAGIQCWLDCFDRAHLAGVIRGTGLETPGDAANNTDLMAQAFETGKSIK